MNFAYDTPEARGELSGYYIKDRGTDANGYAPERDDRGRVKWQQRVMADEVQVDTELSYISDRGFLREYYEKEAKEGKEQESLIYIKRQWDRAQASGIYRSRLNDWQSQTEYLPEGRFDVVGYGLWGGAVLYNQTTRAGNVRWRPDWMVGAASYQTQRADTWHEIEAPFNAGMGGLSVTPFATARETWYADGVNGEEASRYAGSWGTKVSLPPVWRVWGAENALLDVHGLRHVAALDFTYESVYDSTRRPGEVLQFDEVDMVDTLEVATVRLRQRLQTKRERAEEGRMRTVDLASIETEADYFARPGRDNMGKVWSDVRYYGRFAITDDVSVVADGEYDTYGGEFAKAGAWLLVDHSPRTRWSVGTRYVRDTSASAVTIRLDQSITDRWDVALLGQFDTDRGEVLDETVVLRRNLHRFALEILVDYDRGRDETSVGVAFYPLGLGGRRMFY